MDEHNQHLMKHLFEFNALMQHNYSHSFRNWGPFDNPHKGQARVLTLMKSQPEITQKELSHSLNMKNQSLGELLTKLERSGYITRMPSDQDRRIMNIQLTSLGKEVADEVEKKIANIADIFDCLSEQEKGEFIYLLETLITQMKHKTSDNGSCGECFKE